MKKIGLIICLLIGLSGYSQTLPDTFSIFTLKVYRYFDYADSVKIKIAFDSQYKDSCQKVILKIGSSQNLSDIGYYEADVVFNELDSLYYTKFNGQLFKTSKNGISWNFMIDKSTTEQNNYFTVYVIKTNGKFSNILTEEYIITESFENTDDEFLIYPNPVHDVIFFSAKFDNSIVRIVSQSGSIVKEQKLTNFITNYNEVDITNLPQGLYLLLIEGSDGNKIIKKFINN